VKHVVPLKDYCNIGIMAHIDVGKTTTIKRIIFYTKRNYKIREVREGIETMDWMDKNKKEGLQLVLLQPSCFGISHVDFTLEVEHALRVLDGAICLFDSVAGVEPQHETMWRKVDIYGVPRVCFVNKMDHLGANLF
ncbi:hypothetical protein RYX36_017114, partial [Vicia faba]